MIWQISIAVIALAFLTLVVFLVLTLVSLRKSLQLTNETLEDLHFQVNDLTEEAVKVIKSTNQITQDIHEKMRSFDPLFKSIENVSDSIEDATEAFKKVTHSTTHRILENEEAFEEREAAYTNPKQGKVLDVVEWALLGVSLWQKLITRR